MVSPCVLIKRELALQRHVPAWSGREARRRRKDEIAKGVGEGFDRWAEGRSRLGLRADRVRRGRCGEPRYRWGTAARVRAERGGVFAGLGSARLERAEVWPALARGRDAESQG